MKFMRNKIPVSFISACVLVVYAEFVNNSNELSEGEKSAINASFSTTVSSFEYWQTNL